MSFALPIPSSSTSSFLGSIGINSHIGYGGGAYTDANLIGSSLSYLGTTYVRDDFAVAGSRATIQAKLANAGVHFDFVVASNIPAQGNSALAQWVGAVSAFQAAHPGSVTFLEGLNEPNVQAFSYDGSSSLAAAADFQKALYGQVRSDAGLAGIPVIAPSLAYDRVADYAALGSLSGFADYTNSHAYASPLAASASGIISALTKQASAVAPGASVIVTETGTTTYPSYASLGTSELGQARLTITDLLNSYASGSSKTYLYELFDSYMSSTSPEKEHHFGLFNADATPKLAATAVHNLTTILSERGIDNQLGAAPTLGQNASDVHSLVLDAGNGLYDVMLWRDGSIWDATTQQDLSLAPRQVTVNFNGTASSAAVYDPILGVSPVQSIAGVAAISVSLGANPLIVQVGSIDAQLSTRASNLAVQVTPHVEHDFNGDGRSDMLWRHASGAVTDWLSDGTSASDNPAATRTVGADWHILGSGDFNGDGKADVLWRNDNGTVTDWLSAGSGFADNAVATRQVGADWHVSGIADFNGDGRADILWRHDNGTVTEWLSNGPGFADNSDIFRKIGLDWHIVGTGDFNGDGKADILWRNDDGTVTDWLSTGSSFADNAAVFKKVGLDWHIEGTGDFNGDGKVDVLWRNDAGYVTTWLSDGSGFKDNPSLFRQVGKDWHVEGVADLNGDGRDDIVWRHDQGTVTSWTATSDTFVDNPDLFRHVGNDWSIAQNDYWH